MDSTTYYKTTDASHVLDAGGTSKNYQMGGTYNTGAGNLFIGYGILTDQPGHRLDKRTGSHNLVVSDGHSFESEGGLVAGFQNHIRDNSDNSTVLGGQWNHVKGETNVIVGGIENLTQGDQCNAGFTDAVCHVAGDCTIKTCCTSGSCTSGGNICLTHDDCTGGTVCEYTASGGSCGGTAAPTTKWSVVVGGAKNGANKLSTVVLGGAVNQSTGRWSGIGGGYFNDTTGHYAFVAGGNDNVASGQSSSVLGGSGNLSAGDASSALGGNDNEANGDGSICAGSNNTADGSNSGVLGGSDSTTTTSVAVVVGGNSGTASGISSVVVGGYTNTASGSYSVSVAGSYNNSDGQESCVVGGGGSGNGNTNGTYSRSVVVGTTNTDNTANDEVLP